MTEVLLFIPKAELHAGDNLHGFVTSCREELIIFGAALPFNDNIWDVSDSVPLKGHGKKRIRMAFYSLEAVKSNNQSPMAEPFLGFAKAYMRYMHGLRPVVGFGFRLTALRVLEAALLEYSDNPNPVSIDAHVMNRAAQLAESNYSNGVAYRVGGQLEIIAEFLSENGITTLPVRWYNFLSRPGDSVRVGKEFDKNRKEKLPSKAALDTLPKVFNLAVEPSEIIVSSVAAILCSAPDRINEVLLLPELCEVRQNTGENNTEAYGLRWWPAKGAEPMVKLIIPSMSGVVEEAIGKIRHLTNEPRNIAKWYEEHPDQLYLHRDVEYLREREWITMPELAETIGLSGGESASQWCKGNKIKFSSGHSVRKVRFVDVEQYILGMLPDGFPFLDMDVGLKYSEALLIVRVNEMHMQRGTFRCMIEPITINQINTGLGSRIKHGVASIFSRFDFTEDDGSPIKVTTHQFRHYLNTLAQAGGMSQLDIAKWSGRTDVRQNAQYDHVTAQEIVEKIRHSIGDDSQMFGPLAELPQNLPVTREEFLQLKVPTAHTTDLGFCIHDYTMSFCEVHGDCIHCEDLVCVKGDKEKTKRLNLRLEEARQLQAKAMKALDEGYYGSDRWFEHHSSTVERLSQLCAIMDDSDVPSGTIIQLSSNKEKQPKIGNVNTLTSTKNVEGSPQQMLSKVMSSLEK